MKRKMNMVRLLDLLVVVRMGFGLNVIGMVVITQLVCTQERNKQTVEGRF